MSAHHHPVLDIAFPAESSALFATCSGDDIRVWDLPKSRELLRITVPNMICNAIEYMPVSLKSSLQKFNTMSWCFWVFFLSVFVC